MDKKIENDADAIKVVSATSSQDGSVRWAETRHKDAVEISLFCLHLQKDLLKSADSSKADRHEVR